MCSAARSDGRRHYSAQDRLRHVTATTAAVGELARSRSLTSFLDIDCYARWYRSLAGASATCDEGMVGVCGIDQLGCREYTTASLL